MRRLSVRISTKLFKPAKTTIPAVSVIIHDWTLCRRFDQFSRDFRASRTIGSVELRRRLRRFWSFDESVEGEAECFVVKVFFSVQIKGKQINDLAIPTYRS